MKSLKRYSILGLLCLQVINTLAHAYILKSPDGKLQTKVEISDQIRYSVIHGQTEVLAPSPVSMALRSGEIWGANPKLKNKKEQSVNQKIKVNLYKKNEIQDAYNELVLNFSGDYSLIFRAYNQGMAYRFSTGGVAEMIIENEEVSLNFSKNYSAHVPYVQKFDPSDLTRQLFNSFENTYSYLKLSELNKDRLMFLPILVDLEDGKKLCFTEGDLESYPGLYLANKTGNTSLTGVFAPYPKETEQGGHNMLQQIVVEREDFIAKTQGAHNFPWRILAISASDKELLNNDLVYLLASTSRIGDVSWIKPGKVAWDWWNDWNIYGVDFRAGINNETYKYYIDFASKHGIEYVILDEGWAVNKKADLLQVIPEINIRELVEYGKYKNVGIILWAGYWAMDRDLENVCKTYSELGVKGFKVDFMNRDDQYMVDFYYRCAETAAKYKLLIDFHGAYKPTGLNRTFPNVINSEGVFGMEQLKWSSSDVDMVKYDVTMPFIRMLAGPVDYTQGAMRNAIRGNFHPINNEPMSQGTRCHQLAEYVIFESPLNMLCDNPTNYENERECLGFIADVPTIWDETVALESKVGEFVSIARRKGEVWYLGAITNWEKRDIQIDLSFLKEDDYQIEVFKDGVNADKIARDYKREAISLPETKILQATVMPGGGFAARLTKKIKSVE